MRTNEPDASMTCREAGTKGGTVVRDRYGSAFYQNIGRKGGEATSRKHGSDFYRSLGRLAGKKGGDVTRERHGSEFYREIGRLGGQKVKSLVAAGKKAMADAAAEKSDVT